jgi:hypothetical protein
MALRAHSHIVMPISPIHLFVAVNNDQMARRLRSMRPGDLARRSNNLVSEQARKFVYGIDDSQLYFVSRRLGKIVPRHWIKPFCTCAAFTAKACALSRASKNRT